MRPFCFARSRPALSRSALSRMAILLAIGLTVLLPISDASAQLGGIFGGGSGRGSRGNRGDSSGATRNGNNERLISPAPDANSYEQIEYRLSLLQDDLKLTPGQTPVWQGFAAKVRVYAGDMARERARNQRGVTASTLPGSGAQHVSQAVDAARNRLTALEEVETATRALYDALDTEQKKLADARVITIVDPRAPAAPGGSGNRSGNNLPDLGSSQPRTEPVR